MKDSVVYGHLWGTPETRALFSDEGRTRIWLDIIVALLPGNMPHLIDIQLNGRILAATFAVSCAVGLAVGVIPAHHALRPRLADDLRASAGTTRATATWTRSSLVAGQIALLA